MYRFKIFSSPFFSKGAGGIFIAVILGIFAFPVWAGDGLVYGLGTRTNPEEIAGWNIDVGPDGAGLPPGSATLSEGQGIYDMKCARCHGVFGEGVAVMSHKRRWAATGPTPLPSSPTSAVPCPSTVPAP